MAGEGFHRTEFFLPNRGWQGSTNQYGYALYTVPFRYFYGILSEAQVPSFRNPLHHTQRAKYRETGHWPPASKSKSAYYSPSSRLRNDGKLCIRRFHHHPFVG